MAAPDVPSPIIRQVTKEGIDMLIPHGNYPADTLMNGIFFGRCVDYWTMKVVVGFGW